MGALVAYAGIYLILGAISLDTNYVQTNTATVWMPTGFSIGLLVARGPRLWPAVALGAFVLNIASNASSTNAMSIWVEIAIARSDRGRQHRRGPVGLHPRATLRPAAKHSSPDRCTLRCSRSSSRRSHRW